MKKHWERDRRRVDRTPYKAEPNKNVALSDETAARIKQRAVDVRRAIEDARIDRELGVDE